MAEQNPNDCSSTDITKLIENIIKEMEVIKEEMENNSKYQKENLNPPINEHEDNENEDNENEDNESENNDNEDNENENEDNENENNENEDNENDRLPRLPPDQVMELAREEAKQQTQEVKEQIHKTHKRLIIQLGIVQKIEQLQQDLIPLKRKQREGLRNLHKKAKKLKTQAERIQSECRKVHDKFMKAVEIEEQAEGIRLVDVQDITPLEDAGPEAMRQMINKQGEVIKAQLLAQEIQHKIQCIQHEVTEVEQNAHRILWDEYYMKLACLTALRSKDPSTPVGACIVDKNTYQIVGIGYNSMPYVKEGDNDEKFLWKGDSFSTINSKKKYPYVVHAAVNAIVNKTRESIEGCTIYMTLFPDEDCAHAIIKAGITEVVYCMYTRPRHSNDRQEKDMKIAKTLLDENAIPHVKMETDETNELGVLINDIKKHYNPDGTPKGDRPSEARKGYISWEKFFMELAILTKERSTHRDKVGACVVSPEKQVMSIGYNAYPEDMDHSTTGTEEKEESVYMSHAECKAIIGVPSVRNCTLYVTKYPCYQCARAIVQAGITKVVYDKEGGWKDERYISSRETLRTCLGKENIRNIRSYEPGPLTNRSTNSTNSTKSSTCTLL